jgi:hypothetical protein
MAKRKNVQRGMVRCTLMSYACHMKAMLVLAATLALCACAGRSMPAYEAQRFPELDESSLSLEGGTTREEFTGLLRESGATNIIASDGFVGGKVVSAVTADFMEHIYLFGDGMYAGRVRIKHDTGRPQVHPFVKVVQGKSMLGLFLVAENITWEDRRAAQLILIEKGGSITYKHLFLDSLVEKHGGIYDPYVGGDDLSSGLVLCARDGSGRSWDSVYLIKLGKETLRIEPKPVSFAYSCSCFSDWFGGKEGREVFNMKVE